MIKKTYSLLQTIIKEEHAHEQKACAKSGMLGVTAL